MSAGAKVAIVTDISQGTSIAIEKKFAKAGGYSINYDRAVVGGLAKVYVAFDGVQVGAAQAKGILKPLKGKSKPVVARALGRPDGRERVLVQERQRRRSSTRSSRAAS